MLKEYIQICGYPFFLYAIARLLDYWRKSIAAQKKSFLRIVLSIVCIVLWILSFPISLIMCGLNYLHKNLIECNNRIADINRTNESFNSYHRTVVIPLHKQIEILQDERIDTYFTAKDEGYAQGLRDGIKEGYRTGYMDCLEVGPFTDAEKRKHKLEAMEHSIQLSNQRVAEHRRVTDYANDITS